MAIELKEIFLICRLCLSRDESHLIPMAEIFDSTLTIDDIRSFTGVHIDAIDADQRIMHAICLECTSKLKMSAAFRASCISNDYQFNQLWWRFCANSKTDLYDSDTDPFAVEYLEDEGANSDLGAFDDSTLIQQARGFDTNETDNLNDSYNESPVNEQTLEEILQRNVTTNTSKTHVLEDEMLYSANYIALGEPHSDNDESDTWKNNSYLNVIRSLKRCGRAGDSRKLGPRSILFSRASQKRVKPLCDTCGKLVTNLASHITSHTEEFKHVCPHCPTKMKHSSYLIRHIQSVHFKTVVKSCTTCNIGFKHYTTYRSHMYTEHGVGEPHECPVCSRRFHAACRLRKHIKGFHNTDEHDCEVCGRTFKLREHLKRHQKRVHTNGQPYKCSQCPKRFKCASYRKNHELTHHSNIVIECPLCDTSFRYKYQINAHIRKMHPAANSETETAKQEIGACSETATGELVESN